MTKAKILLPPLSETPPAPLGIVKTSPRGRRYRVYTVPLSLLPQFLESKRMEPKLFFYYVPEKDYLLGVRRRKRKGFGVYSTKYLSLVWSNDG